MEGLEYALQKSASSPISIFEVGFGTGLNALLTLQYSVQHQKKIHYTSIEGSPLPEVIWSQLNYAVLLDLPDEYKALHDSTWGIAQSLTSHFNLLKLNVTLQQFEFSPAEYDLVYYDAF